MKYFLPLILLCSSAYSAPPIFPGEDGSESYFPTVRFQNTGCAVAWFYDGGHRWIKAGFYGADEDCRQANDKVKAAIHIDASNIPDSFLGFGVGVKMLMLSHEEKVLLWDAIFVVHPGDQGYDETVLHDMPGRALYDAIPYPTSIPPSGLVTQDTKAYRLNRVSNSTPTFTLFGSVALGVPCDAQDLNGYHRIDLAAVKVPAKVLKPLEAFARCTQ